MRIVYFITIDNLKKYTPINLNVEDSIVKKAILDAQKIKLQQDLGSCLYKKIEDLYISAFPAGNEKYQTLFDDYIYDYVIQWSLVEILPYVRYKIHNKGVNTQSSEETATADFEEYKYLLSLLTNKAEFYSARLKSFLIENVADYTEYSNCCDCGDLSPAKTSYFSGIQFY